MKSLLLACALTLFFSGCATKNAFETFSMKAEQEKAVENTRSAKILFKEQVGGIFSAVYLNNIYPNMDANTDVFYISIYRKDKSKKLEFHLNEQKTLSVKELASFSKYARLLSIKNRWSTNYLVTFRAREEKKLHLLIDSDPFSSGSLEYLKALQ